MYGFFVASEQVLFQAWLLSSLKLFQLSVTLYTDDHTKSVSTGGTDSFIQSFHIVTHIFYQ